MASKPQGSSERVLPYQVTTDQLIYASLSHTHYWYEVSILKVPAIPMNQCTECLLYVWSPSRRARVRINRVRLPILLVVS